jgi:hypothetical protein
MIYSMNRILESWQFVPDDEQLWLRGFELRHEWVAGENAGDSV